MISEQCQIQEFIDAVKGMESDEVIRLAAEEATAAERLALRRHICDRETGRLCDAEYAKVLKELINYLATTPSRPGSESSTRI